MDTSGPPRGYSGRPNGNYGGRSRGRGARGGGGGGGGPRSPRADRHTSSYNPEEIYTKRDIFTYFWPGREFAPTDVSTLNDSVKSPFQLAYVFVFPGGNPRWREQQVLFSKSKLELLPGYHSEKAKAQALMDDGISTQSDDEAEDAMITRELKQAIDNIEADEIPHSDGSSDVLGSTDVQTEGLGSKKVDTTDTSPEPRHAAQDIGVLEKKDEQPTEQPKYPFGSLDIRALERERARLHASHPPHRHASQDVRLTEGHNDRPANTQREMASGNEKKPEVPVIDYIPPKHNPIAFFLSLDGNDRNYYAFIGWYSITNIEILLPGNPMTVTMMEIKWPPRRDKLGNWIPGGKDHPRFVNNPQLWDQDLNTEWAAIRFEKWEKNHPDFLSHPAIKKLPPEPSWPQDHHGQKLGAAPHCSTCTCHLASHEVSPNKRYTPGQNESRKCAPDQLDSRESKVENWLRKL